MGSGYQNAREYIGVQTLQRNRLRAKKVRVRPRSLRDFESYLKWCRNWCRIKPLFNPFQIDKLPRGITSALQAYVNFDGRGVVVPCKQPRLLRAVLEGKNLLNFQIKQWAEGYWDCGGGGYYEELQSEYPYLPEWVWEALVNQAQQYKPENWDWRRACCKPPVDI
jgi:hypothetical protein